MKYNPSTSAASNFKINVRATSTSYLILGGGSNYWVNVIERFIFRRHRRRRRLLHSAGNVYFCLAERELPDALPVVRQPKMDRQTHDNRPETCPFRHGARVRAFLFCFVLSINTKTIKKYTHPHSRQFLFDSFSKLLHASIGRFH